MSTIDEIEKEKQRLSERLARVEAERSRLAEQLNELEVAERVLSRFGGTGAAPRRRGRPAKAAAKAPAPQRRRARAQAGGVSVSDAVLKVVHEHPGAGAGDVLNTLSSQYGLKVRPNHLGIALQRHRRAGRLEQRDERWYPPHAGGHADAAGA